MIKKIVIVNLIICILISITSCNRNEVKLEEDNKYKIGLCMEALVVDRWNKDRDIFVAKAKELGAEVIVKNANEDTQKQIEQVNELIKQDVDVIVIIPHDKDSLTHVINNAKKKGIKIVAYDRLIRNSEVDLYISFDNIKVGELMGDYLLQKVPQGNYIIINGSNLDNNSYMLNSGYKGILNDEINDNNIKIVDEVWANGWREEIAYNSVENAINDGIKIDGIIGANDRLAEGAIQALAEHGLLKETYVVGHDADLSACQRIVEGTQLMTVYKPIRLLAQGAAEYAVKLAKGEKLNLNDSISDGSYNVPIKKYEPIAITKENIMDTVINDGFHSLNDVYRNIPEEQIPNVNN